MSKFELVIKQASAVRNSIDGNYERMCEERIANMKKASIEWDKSMDGRRNGRLKKKIPPQVPENFLSAQTVAQMCGVTSRRIVEICNRGDIVSEKIGGKWYIPSGTANRLVKAYNHKKATKSHQLFV